ncbi:cell division protein SepF [Aquibacillus kalidii]|uniref:cell division protein SepF n=1 Tax=Aquibacillus kalidii TaxID=2762597 RepID=UPI001646B10C|nr:cell division protein SepF [Aquibacillus kalidii]
MSLKNKFRTFFSVEDEYEYIEEHEQEQPELDIPSTPSRRDKKQNVVSLKSVQTTSKVVLCEPSSFNEAQEIADHIINRRSIVINLQRVDHNDARHIVDFLSGTVYALSGTIQKLGTKTFLCTPDNVDVSGNITEMLEEDIDKGW